jgi:hypothetical protein
MSGDGGVSPDSGEFGEFVEDFSAVRAGQFQGLLVILGSRVVLPCRL